MHLHSDLGDWGVCPKMRVSGLCTLSWSSAMGLCSLHFHLLQFPPQCSVQVFTVLSFFIIIIFKSQALRGQDFQSVEYVLIKYGLMYDLKCDATNRKPKAAFPAVVGEGNWRINTACGEEILGRWRGEFCLPLVSGKPILVEVKRAFHYNVCRMLVKASFFMLLFITHWSEEYLCHCTISLCRLSEVHRQCWL